MENKINRDTIARYAFWGVDGYWALMYEVLRRRGLNQYSYSIGLDEVVETIAAMTDEELSPFIPKEK